MTRRATTLGLAQMRAAVRAGRVLPRSAVSTRQANAEAARARALAQLVASCPRVAHEFNGLLLTISAGVMVMRDGSRQPRALERNLDLIDKAAQQARLMTRALIRLSQPDHSGPRCVNLVDIAEEMASFGRGMLPGEISMTLDVPTDGVVVLVPQGELLALMLDFMQHAALVLTPGSRVRVCVGTTLGADRVARGHLLLRQEVGNLTGQSHVDRVSSVHVRWTGSGPLRAKWPSGEPVNVHVTVPMVNEPTAWGNPGKPTLPGSSRLSLEAEAS